MAKRATQRKTRRPLRTVREHLTDAARDGGVDAAVMITARTQKHFGTLPDRYRRLAERVWLQLPADWDSHADWDVIAGEIASEVETYLAGTQRHHREETPGDLQRWTIQLVPSALEDLTDDAVERVIAHEFAHVASGLDMDVMLKDIPLAEDRANAIMRWWGFQTDER